MRPLAALITLHNFPILLMIDHIPIPFCTTVAVQIELRVREWFLRAGMSQATSWGKGQCLLLQFWAICCCGGSIWYIWDIFCSFCLVGMFHPSMILYWHFMLTFMTIWNSRKIIEGLFWEIKVIFQGICLGLNFKEFLLCIESTMETIVSLPYWKAFRKLNITTNNMSLEGSSLLLEGISFACKAVMCVDDFPIMRGISSSEVGSLGVNKNKAHKVIYYSKFLCRIQGIGRDSWRKVPILSFRTKMTI